jgi:hypothetical protein
MNPYSMKAGCAIASVFAAAAFARPAAADEWTLRLPKEDKVVYRGLVNADKAGLGSDPGILYGPGLVGFFVVLGAHGLVVDSQKRSQLQKLQDDADKVLLPYRDALEGYAYADLMRRALDRTLAPGEKKLVAASEKPGTGWFVESFPIFAMTQDQKAIVLENAVSIHAPGAAGTPYQNIIKIVSQPNGEADPRGFWSANRGERLKEESVNLLAHSFDMAMGHAAGSLDAGSDAQKTFRYLEGSTERMERATLVTAYCNRAVIKTLRGWLMSVPTKPGSAASPPGQCASAPNNL